LINWPVNITYTSDHIFPEMLRENLQKLYQQLIIWYNQDNNINKDQLSEKFSAQSNLDLDQSYLNSLYVFVDQQLDGFSEEQINQELVKVVKQIKLDYYQQQIKKLDQQLGAAETNQDKEQINKIIKELQDITDKKNQMN